MAREPLRLRFLGGAGTVTGSRTVVETDGFRLLVDCGLFQGWKTLRLRNWAPFPVPPETIDAVVLTHAHIDHSGWLPLLIRGGFAGPVHATAATRDLCAVLLPDSGRIHERDAEYANRKGFSKHRPALPLFTAEEGERALDAFETAPFDRPIALADDVELRFHRAGHILGAAWLSLRVRDTRIVFSGDLGRPGCPVMVPPDPVREADVVVVESTYGDRRHERTDPAEALAEVVRRTVARGGTVVIPAFAVGRTQILLYHLEHLRREGRIPAVPIYLDSPMAIDATEIFRRHVGEHRLGAERCADVCGTARLVHAAEQSMRLDESTAPMILISASGMATGGRVLHHLARFAPEPANTLLFAGFQAPGTRGERIVRGEPAVRIHGELVPIRAEVQNLDMLSAHADADEILAWLDGIERPPRMAFVNHGEPAAADCLRLRIRDALGWRVHVADQGETWSAS
ncbi:MAG: MBL fold metallo-hydrolase [Myxococcota bacterium]